MHAKRYWAGLIAVGFVSLVGCAQSPDTSSEAIVQPNRVITQTVRAPLPPLKLRATFGLHEDQRLENTYHRLLKHGEAQAIRSPGFVTLPFDTYAHPLLACAPLRLCVIQLEQAERVNNIALGDSLRWLVSTALVGTEGTGSTQITLKPTAENIATDLVVTTNKRTYNIGLVSQSDQATHVMRFYYPEESLQESLALSHQAASRDYTPINTTAPIDLNHVHFDYVVRGDHPRWRPIHVFDDGHKTFIQLPRASRELDLPILYLRAQHQLQLVNYRYQAPYYVIDGLFETAWLIAGRGHHQTRVEIIHHQA